MKTNWRKLRSATESGVFPKPDFSTVAPQEAPEPPAPAETDDPGSVTGVLPIIPEGEDAAKDQDDSAAGKRR
jgi:hypothetical protein